MSSHKRRELYWDAYSKMSSKCAAIDGATRVLLTYRADGTSGARLALWSSRSGSEAWWAAVVKYWAEKSNCPRQMQRAKPSAWPSPKSPQKKRGGTCRATRRVCTWPQAESCAPCATNELCAKVFERPSQDAKGHRSPRRGLKTRQAFSKRLFRWQQPSQSELVPLLSRWILGARRGGGCAAGLRWPRAGYVVDRTVRLLSNSLKAQLLREAGQLITQLLVDVGRGLTPLISASSIFSDKIKALLPKNKFPNI